MIYNKQKSTKEIDLGEICTILLSKINIIIVFVLFFMLFSMIVTIFVIPRKYESKISMYVNNNQEIKEGSINLSDINASKSLVNTYMAFLQSDSIMYKVVQQINHKNYDIQKLKDIINCNQVNATEIFEIVVKTDNPLLSAQIADYIAKIAPSEIQRVFKSGSVEVIDTAKVATKHSSPSLVLNTAIGGAFGLLLSVCCILIIKINDQIIRTPNDFEEKYSVPLLGIVPNRLI